MIVAGEPRHLGPGIDLTAYRIVQEALTNTLKHAGPARAVVELRYSARDLEIDVTDDGRGVANTSSNGAGSGHGLVGMRERVNLYGRTLHARHATHGFEVRARLPLDPGAAA